MYFMFKSLSVEIKDNQFVKIKGNPHFLKVTFAKKPQDYSITSRPFNRTFKTPARWFISRRDVAIQEIADRLVQIRDKVLLLLRLGAVDRVTTSVQSTTFIGYEKLLCI